MANTKLDRIERDIEKTRAKVLDGAQLAAFLSAYASGEITLPQPEAAYPAEQEDSDNEE